MRVLIIGSDMLFCRASAFELEEEGFVCNLSPKFIPGYDVYLIDADMKYKPELPKKSVALTFSVREGMADFTRPFDMADFRRKASELVPTSSRENKTGTFKADGEKISLSRKERALFSLLVKNTGETVTVHDITTNVFGKTEDDTNLVRVYISYLREKLRKSGDRRLIHSVRGKGYRIDR